MTRGLVNYPTLCSMSGPRGSSPSGGGGPGQDGRLQAQALHNVGQPSRQVVKVEVPSRHGPVVVQHRLLRMRQPARHLAGFGRGQPFEPQRSQLFQGGVLTDGNGAQMERGFHGRVPEALPRRRKGDHVSGRIGVLDAGTGGHYPRHHPPVRRHCGAGQELLQGGLVTFLGSSDKPVVGAQRLRQRHARGDAFAGDGPRRLHDQQLVGPNPQELPDCLPVSLRRPGVKQVMDGNGVDAPAEQLEPGKFGGDDVAPLWVVWGRWEAAESGALPRQVVVMHERRPPR